MNTRILAVASLPLLLVAALPLSAPARTTATGLQRCEGSDGTVVYTDRACARHGARPAPMSGELITRIADEEARSYADASLEPVEAVDATTTGIATARRSLQDGCARSPAQLAMDLQASLALGDVNRVAESYHWIDMRQRAALQVLARLGDLAERPVVHARYYNARIDAGRGASAAGHDNGGAGLLQVMLGDGAARRVVDFDVRRYAGCYFVRF